MSYVRHRAPARSIGAVVVVIVVVVTGFLGSRQTVRAQAPQGGSSDAATNRARSFVRAAEQHLDYLPGEVLVKFKDGVTTFQQQSALGVLRSRPSVADLEWIGNVALVRDTTESDARLLAAQLRAQPEVDFAEPNYLRHLDSTPTDPSFSRQWNFSALDIPRVWDINGGGDDKTVVAVLDTGITTINQALLLRSWNGTAIQTISVRFATNPDLSASRLVSPKDFVFELGPVVDMDGHATHVSSTIGEDTNNAIAEAGIAFRTKIMPVKVCVGYWDVQFAISDSGQPGFVPPGVGGCPTSAIVQGIRYAADNGAKVINLSLGGPTSSTAEHDALTYAVGKGAFITISMGNAYEDGNPVEYPAADAATIDGAMSVGAVGRSLKRSFYSSTGSHIEIAAPGGDDRDGGVDGLIWQSTISREDLDPETVVFPRFDRYVEGAAEGTSMAAPHVAGLAALLVAQGITKPAAIEALIKATARDLGAPGRDSEYGYGLIQPRAALRGVGVK